jgi:hypothetical protein
MPMFEGIRTAQKRVHARAQQLVAWRNMLGARTVTRTRIALAVVDALRIAAYIVVVMKTVRTEMPLPFAVAIMALGWLALSGLHLALRDAILARAFDTMSPASSQTSASSGPRVAPLSPGAQAAVRRAQTPRAPRARPKPAIVLADRDAVDFDDAMSGPVRAFGPLSTRSGTGERNARDFDDV